MTVRTAGMDRRLVWAAAAVALFIVGLGLVASIGGGHGFLEGLATVIVLLVAAGTAPAAYMVASLGLGRVFVPLFRGARDPWSAQFALGMGAMLTLSHGMGVLGLLGSGGWLIAGAPVGVGLVLLAHQLTKAGGLHASRAALPVAALAGAPGVVLLLVAACNPPGWLWASEFGGFDALSYHLQLPQEWLLGGRVWPLEHNVYSFLPGYLEAAYLHVGVLMGATGTAAPGSPLAGLIAGDGDALIACQLLHALLAIAAAVLVARGVVRAGERCGVAGRAARIGAGLAAAMVLLTPWSIVVGSLAYNEMGVLALGAGALVAAMDDGIPAARRGAVAGLLVGLACGAKPTALAFVGVPVGVMLLGMAPRREWARIVAAGSAAGVAALAPWLVRNFIACGNPVFPFATGVFGTAHWTAEQAARYAAGHVFDGTLLERLTLLVLADPSGPAGARQRGMLHPQWFAFFPACAAAAAAAALRAPIRWVGALLIVGMLGQAGAWLFATHLQSRFLLPMLAPGAVLFGLAGAGLIEGRGRGLGGPAAAAVTMGFAVVAAQGIASLATFAREGRGRGPNAALIGGPGEFSGERYRGAFAGATSREREEFLASRPAPSFVNLAMPAGARLYLLGDSTPLYFREPVLYHTTWDRSPFGEAVRNDPGEPARWTAALRARGIGLVLVDFGEIARLRRSGWYDPAVTPDVVGAWVAAEATVIREWPGSSQVLVAIGAGGGD